MEQKTEAVKVLKMGVGVEIGLMYADTLNKKWEK